MKKLAGMLLSLILIVGLAACGSNDPASVYASAAKKYRKADGAEMIVNQKVTVNDGGVALTSGISGSMKWTAEDEAVTKAAMEGNMEIDLGTGTPMIVPMSYYFSENTLYANMAGTQYKTTMEWAAAAEQMGPGSFLLMNLEKEDFQDLTMKEEEEKQILSFIISSDKMDQVTGAIAQWNQYLSVYGNEGSISFQNIKGSIVVQDGYPVSEELVLAGTLTVDGRNVAITAEIDIQVTTYEEVEVVFPDLSSYQSLSGNAA